MYVSCTSPWILSVALALGVDQSRCLVRAIYRTVFWRVQSYAVAETNTMADSIGSLRTTGRLVRRKERDADGTVCDRFLGGYLHGMKR